MEYNELRNKYTDFYYHSFLIEENDEQIKITYTLKLKIYLILNQHLL